MTDQRQSGRTSRQLERAPRYAVFVWSVLASRDYAVKLASSIGRDDIMIVGPDWLISGRWRGDMRPVVLDHACNTHPTIPAEFWFAWGRYVQHIQGYDA